MQGGSCVACPPGTTNGAGDDASGADTSCEAVLCGEGERVQGHVCVACPAGETNEAGDAASGTDTACVVLDACYRTLGLPCDQVVEGYLKASNSEKGDGFGGRVSLWGDRLAVGAQGESSCADGVDPPGGQTNKGCKSAGAVYLFRRDMTTGAWVQEAYLKASNSGEGDYFGSAVSLVGDRLAVGADGEASCADGIDPPGGQANNECNFAGAVYLFERNAATGAWAQTAYLKASNSEARVEFGRDVSLEGDRLAVGATRERSCADGVNPPGGQTNNGCDDAGAGVRVQTRRGDRNLGAGGLPQGQQL